MSLKWGVCIHKWIAKAANILATGNDDNKQSPFHIKRLAKLLNPKDHQEWTSDLERYASKLSVALGQDNAGTWADVLSSLLSELLSNTNQFSRGTIRGNLRDIFPAYPLVHLTMLSRIKAPLDWFAVPLGSMLEHTQTNWPQAGAFVLAAHQEPEDVTQCIAALRPILTTIAFSESRPWIEQSFSQKTHEAASLRRRIEKRAGLTELIASSPKMKELLERLDSLKNSNSSILFRGETGCGKTVLARYVHKTGDRAQKPLVECNVNAIEHLFESEMFGHEKGAFTGASELRIGRFEQADGGTLFLDEIGILTRESQAKLLSVLADKRFTRVGSNVERTSDFRLITATNEDIAALVKSGDFRLDLLQRIHQEVIPVPPLRERKEDILPIFNGFFDAGAGNRENLRLDESMETFLLTAEWPGNVRELKDVALHMAEVSKSALANLAELKRYDASRRLWSGTATVIEAPDSNSIETLSDDYLLKILRQKFYPNNRRTSLPLQAMTADCRELVVKILRLLVSRGLSRQQIIDGVGFRGPTYDAIYKSVNETSSR